MICFVLSLACQCPPRCVKGPRRCFILGMCTRCKAPHLGKRSTPDPRFGHHVIMHGIRAGMTDELDLAMLQNSKEPGQSSEYIENLLDQASEIQPTWREQR